MQGGFSQSLNFGLGMRLEENSSEFALAHLP